MGGIHAKPSKNADNCGPSFHSPAPQADFPHAARDPHLVAKERDRVISFSAQQQTFAPPDVVTTVLQALRHHGKEQKHREDDQVYDALKHRGPARAQRDHADEERQHQQNLVLLAQP